MASVMAVSSLREVFDFNTNHPVTSARIPITGIDSAQKAVSVNPMLEYAGTMLVELSVIELVTVLL